MEQARGGRSSQVVDVERKRSSSMSLELFFLLEYDNGHNRFFFLNSKRGAWTFCNRRCCFVVVVVRVEERERKGGANVDFRFGKQEV